MAYIAQKLKYRVQICRGVQTPNDDGGFDFTRSVLLTLWGGFRPLGYAEYIRGVQVGRQDTHEFIFRKCSLVKPGPEFHSCFDDSFDTVNVLGIQYTGGYGTGFVRIVDLNLIKSDYFLFLERGGVDYKGRFFRIRRVQDVGEREDYYKVLVEEMEQYGTGHPA